MRLKNKGVVVDKAMYIGLHRDQCADAIGLGG
jgi:hypothetical protein